VLGAVLMAIAVVGVQVADMEPGSATVAACDAVEIPSLGLSRCVVPGGQVQIDAGHVVRVDYLSSADVHWLAGHRTSHGSTFSSLPQLRVGATVRFRDRIYVVTDYRLVNRFSADEVMPWMASPNPSVVLQTSATGDLVHVWRSVALVPTAPLVATGLPPIPR
jgi:hypothetical protein